VLVDEEPTRVERGSRHRRRAVRTRSDWLLVALVVVVLLAQFVVLAIRSRHQWQHFNLSLDFAIFHQAYHQIGAGDLNPKLTLFGYRFWQSHFELIMWPVALLGRLHRNDGLSLLYLQDLAHVAAEAVVIAWVWTETRKTERGWPVLVTVPIALVLLVANPWPYLAALQDFHFESLATFFVLLAGWDLWNGRRRGWIWIALTLLCGDVSATYVAGLGLSFAVVSRRTRRDGLVLIATGVAWVALVAILGANKGSGLADYSYLTSSGKEASGLGGALAIAAGMLRHPSRPLRAIWHKLGRVYRNLAPTGVVGLVAPWTFGVMVTVLLANALNGKDFFVLPSYQNWPIYLFGTLGTVLLVHAWSARPGRWHVVAAVVLLVVVANALVFDAAHRQHAKLPYQVSGAAAHELAMARRAVPGHAQIVASFGVAGRFAGRKHAYALLYGGQRFPIRERQVMFLFAPGVGNEPLPPDITGNDERYVRNILRARVVVDGNAVRLYDWRPAGPGTVRLP
jgi:predicted membrane protein DUF2079